LRPAAFATIAVGIVFCGASRLGIRINLSPSLPIGLYQVASGPDATLVEFCPPEPFASMANARGYRQPGTCPDGGTPLMKPVVARAGDTVRLSEKGVSVNGRALPNSAPLLKDTTNRPLSPWPYGAYVVQPGTIWAISTFNPRSFDSRYFGPISEPVIRNHVWPLLVLPYFFQKSRAPAELPWAHFQRAVPGSFQRARGCTFHAISRDTAPAS
jgi:conjugative transfer signal peptidase TraF